MDALPKEISSQERVFQFLTDAQHHPHVRRIDTHAASVFLEGTRALKIKRAVRFPFLDYSTLEKRKAACEDEIRINRPFAPSIYLRVVSITQDDVDRLHIDGPGRPIEYAVEMTRFDERRTLDHLAAAGPLEDALVLAMADAVAASHFAAPRVAGQSWLDAIPDLIEANASALQRAGCFDPDQIDELTQTSLTTHARIRDLLAQRGTQGFVRRCHGDLHLGNLVQIGDKPVLFDAIEFDEKMATIDTLYDLAFLLMDLLYYQQPVAANGLFNRYLTLTPVENLAALACLPLFMSMRAAVRAHVVHARVEREVAEMASISAAAHDYFNLARCLIHPPVPRLIAVGGLSGTGKSVLAHRLAPLFGPPPGAVLLRSDVLRKQLFGVNETCTLPSAAYAHDVALQVYGMVRQRARQMLEQGHSVMVDAVFAHEDERCAIEDIARQLHIPFQGLFLTASLATRQLRINSRAADASDATAEVAEVQEHYDLGSLDWAQIDASGTVEQTVALCRRSLSISE